MSYQYLKSLHIIFVVTWFAGLFYIVRLFVYFSETTDKPEPEKTILQEQYKIMQKRLWFGIAWPSAILTLIFGTSLVLHYNSIPDWLWIKLGFVAGLFAYHVFCHHIFRLQQKSTINYSSTQLRIINELATLFLFAIVFIVVLKSTFSWVYGLLALALLTVVLLISIKIYKTIRTKA